MAVGLVQIAIQKGGKKGRPMIGDSDDTDEHFMD
jgi:hypothetical protein